MCTARPRELCKLHKVTAFFLLHAKGAISLWCFRAGIRQHLKWDLSLPWKWGCFYCKFGCFLQGAKFWRSPEVTRIETFTLLQPIAAVSNVNFLSLVIAWATHCYLISLGEWTSVIWRSLSPCSPSGSIADGARCDGSLRLLESCYLGPLAHVTVMSRSWIFRL